MGNRFKTVSISRRTFDGIVFDSLKEMNRYMELKLLEKAGLIRELKHHPGPYRCFISGIEVCKFTPDFEYVRTDNFNEMVTEEVKSSGTQKDAAYRLRKKCFEAQYGRKVTEIIK